ncbi:MAG: stage II sporulation protein P [Clostridia bacterium]|nr:stage II sporulation protein P [Clostridia bacterium]
MKNKGLRNLIAVLIIASVIALTVIFNEFFIYAFSQLALKSAKSYLPDKGITLPTAVSTTAESTTAQPATEPTTEKAVSVTVSDSESFTDTPEDIKKIIAEREKTASKDKKDGTIYEKQYKNEGVTDSFGLVKVKNVNKTDIDIEQILGEKIDLSVSADKPSVLIFHTHTTETYQILDRGFYETNFATRTKDSGQNMIRVGEEICREIEMAGYKVIHDKEIHDLSYNGAYAHSRKKVEEYLKKHPSIQIVLDIHRDAIQQSDGSKIKPTATINGKKAAQIMIISGCQEEGNPIENFPDWRYNLTFAVHLQNQLEKMYQGITRPLYFCPRKYNMNVSHCSLLVEVGSDANTLEEAVYTGRC